MTQPPVRRHLTDRDVEILHALDRCPLTATQLLKLSQTFPDQPFTSARSVQDRLQKLRHVGWIQSWPYAIAARGNAPDYYKLTLAGFRLLHGEHAAPPTRRHFAEVSVGHHHHTRSLAEFIVHTIVAGYRRGIRVVNFFSENGRRLCIDSNLLLPDCAFEMYTADHRQFNFLVEIDCGTERIRSDRDVESWTRKIRLYNLLQDRNYPDRFRVLVVGTRSADRVRSILSLAAAHATNPRRSLLYAVPLNDYLRHPDAVCAPCFRNHRDETVTLVSAPAPALSGAPGMMPLAADA